MNKYMFGLVCGGLLAGMADVAEAQLSCEDLGYTMTVADCVNDRILKCPFDENKVLCSTFATVKDPSNCQVGAILYSDKKCYANPPTGVKAIGVVFDRDNRLAIALRQESNLLPENSGSYVTACDFFNKGFENCPNSGYENTEAIRTNPSITDTAVSFCYDDLYNETGYHWFVPSLSEMVKLLTNRKRVELGLYGQGIKNFFNGDLLTSNLGPDNSYVYLINLSSGEIESEYIGYDAYTICALHY